MRKKIGEKGYVAECKVSHLFISTTLLELNKGKICYAFNDFQLNVLIQMVPDLVYEKKDFYIQLQKRRFHHAYPSNERRVITAT